MESCDILHEGRMYMHGTKKHIVLDRNKVNKGCFVPLDNVVGHIIIEYKNLGLLNQSINFTTNHNYGKT